jgi:hypothetical protein
MVQVQEAEARQFDIVLNTDNAVNVTIPEIRKS